MLLSITALYSSKWLIANNLNLEKLLKQDIFISLISLANCDVLLMMDSPEIFNRLTTISDICFLLVVALDILFCYSYILSGMKEYE